MDIAARMGQKGVDSKQAKELVMDGRWIVREREVCRIRPGFPICTMSKMAMP